MRRRRFLLLALATIAAGGLFAIMSLYYSRGVAPGDAFTYLAAGERLNAGHDLYRLSTGDRAVQIDPARFQTPLVSPPLIAVLWRPLAAMPNELGLWVWWIAQITALGVSLAMLASRLPVATAGAIFVLLIPTVYEFAVGNVNAFLLLGLILTWRLSVDDRHVGAGLIAAVMTFVKLTPAVLCWWLLVAAKRRAAWSALATGVVALGVSVVGAGFDAHLEYLRILSDRSRLGIYPLSLAGLGEFLGVSRDIALLLPAIGAVAGLAAVFLLRRWLAYSYIAAVATVILGSPAVSINWLVLLYALIAPFAWPISGSVEPRGHLANPTHDEAEPIPRPSTW